MRYAILQKDLSIPTVESLKRAFQGSGFLTALDAHTFAKDAFGILVRNLHQDQAAQIHRSLLEQGIDNEIVPEKSVPKLPETKFLSRVDCLDQHLLLYDPLGRAIPLNWGHLMVIAAGSMDRRFLKRITVDRPRTPLLEALDLVEAPRAETVLRPANERALVVDLILNRAVLMYSISADRLQFNYLGERKSRNLRENYTTFVKDLVDRAPQALLNRGAMMIRDHDDPSFLYPTRNAFTEEILWLLWQQRRT